MVQIVKQIVSIDSKQKKGRVVLPGAAQVYGGQVSEKTTYIGLFKNAACTLALVVARSFTAPPKKWCGNGARS